MTYRHLAPALLALIALALSPAAASANDASFGGKGTQLVPLKEGRIQMVSEDIVMEQKHDKRVSDLAWFVDTRYRFHNPTKEEVTLQMGFPETWCHPDGECSGTGGRFRNLEVRVDGEPVKVRVGKIKKEARDWVPHLGRVHLFEVTFAPGQTRAIEHDYTYDTSVSVEGLWVDYVTRTGRLWRGPIKEATFTVRLAQRPWMVSWPPEYKLQSYTERPVGGGHARTELVFEMKDWTPTRDFSVHVPGFHNAAGPIGVDCPVALDAQHASADDLAADIPPKLKPLTDAQLRLCRNLPYAHHGYAFKSADLRRAFYGKSRTRTGWGYPWWPTHDSKEHEGAQRWSWLTLRPNPHFSTALLTKRERTWVRLIKAEEAERKKAKGKK